MHTWLQHHITERLHSARPGPHPPLLAEAHATLALAMTSYEQCRCCLPCCLPARRREASYGPPMREVNPVMRHADTLRTAPGGACSRRGV